MGINFFIGYDSKEDIAYRVCKHSLLKRSSIKVNVMSLKLDELMVNVDFGNIVINDESSDYTSGNNDGIINPGETAIIEVPLYNLGTETVFDLQATLSTDSDLVNIVKDFK